MLKCSCEVPVLPHVRNCHACGEDVGYPNVRKAEEEAALINRRFDDALASGVAKGSDANLKLFQTRVEQSHAVIARPLSKVLDLMDNENALYTSYQAEVAANARMPANNEFDKVRNQFEEAVAPNYAEHIRFAALTIDRRWLRSYGAYAMILKDRFIARRATVFEENPYNFVKRHRVLLSEPIPDGFRATWQKRGELAVSKLHSKIEATTPESAFTHILLTDNGTTADCDYIEVHIYDGFTRDAVECVLGPTPRTREDRLSWKRLRRLGQKFSFGVEEL